MTGPSTASRPRTTPSARTSWSVTRPRGVRDVTLMQAHPLVQAYTGRTVDVLSWYATVTPQ